MSPRLSLRSTVLRFVIARWAGELLPYNGKPSHSQNSDALDDLVDLFGCIFWRFHFEPKEGETSTEVATPAHPVRGVCRDGHPARSKVRAT
jgi:hypothetical protein